LLDSGSKRRAKLMKDRNTVLEALEEINEQLDIGTNTARESRELIKEEFRLRFINDLDRIRSLLVPIIIRITEESKEVAELEKRMGQLSEHEDMSAQERYVNSFSQQQASNQLLRHSYDKDKVRNLIMNEERILIRDMTIMINNCIRFLGISGKIKDEFSQLEKRVHMVKREGKYLTMLAEKVLFSMRAVVNHIKRFGKRMPNKDEKHVLKNYLKKLSFDILMLLEELEDARHINKNDDYIQGLLLIRRKINNLLRSIKSEVLSDPQKCSDFHVKLDNSVRGLETYIVWIKKAEG
tara:strand:- start:6140 stop:7024 length:885 start_codon:yes stop_codon:yes gene_type:complete